MNELLNLYLAHQGKVSDKWSSYLTAYDRLFDEQRDKPVRLLEIGIQNGGSLEIWSSYFRNATALVGCDINPDCAALSYNDPRISLIVGDANNPEVSERVFQRSPQFDIIIDDGSHRSSDIVKSFALYFSHLVDGGVYIAEDLHCSYWADFEGGLLYPYSSISFFKHLADVINFEHWGVTRERSDVLRGFFKRYGCEIDIEVLSQVHSIEFINSLCVVRKNSPASNNLGRRVIAGSIELVVPNMLELNDSLLPVYDQSNNPWAMRNPPPDEAIENTELLLACAQQQLAEEQQRLSDIQQAHAAHEEQQHQEITNLHQQFESQRAQAQERVDQLSQQATQQIQVLQAAAAEQTEQLQGQIMALQRELLERERAFTQQWTTWRAEEQQRVSETQQAHAAREEQQRQEITNLHQQLESQRAQAQERVDQLSQQATQQIQVLQAAAAEQTEQLQGQIMALQRELLERERAFTQQWTTLKAEEQQRAFETQQVYAAHVAQLREDARVQIDNLRASLNHHTTYGHALAVRLASMQSTWWWRLSMPWRRPSRWPDIASSLLPPTHCEIPQPEATTSEQFCDAPPTKPEK